MQYSMRHDHVKNIHYRIKETLAGKIWQIM